MINIDHGSLNDKWNIFFLNEVILNLIDLTFYVDAKLFLNVT